jgi:uncharacterized protein
MSQLSLRSLESASSVVRHSPSPVRLPGSAAASRLLCLLALALLAAGCRDRPPETDLDVVRMQLGVRTFTLEVADTEPARNYGLMRRDSLPRNHGMIFVFPDERRRAFWMKNVRFPLDIIFLDAEGKIVSIHRMEAYDTSSTRSDGPARYAIEINAGRAAELGLKPGDILEIPSGAREPR